MMKNVTPKQELRNALAKALKKQRLEFAPEFMEKILRSLIRDGVTIKLK